MPPVKKKTKKPRGPAGLNPGPHVGSRSRADDDVPAIQHTRQQVIRTSARGRADPVPRGRTTPKGGGSKKGGGRSGR